LQAKQMSYRISQLVPFVVLVAMSQAAISQDAQPQRLNDNVKAATVRSGDNTPANVLPADEWQRVDQAVNRALTWLAKQQQADGSFPTRDITNSCG
jgi:hypothetical protein